MPRKKLTLEIALQKLDDIVNKMETKTLEIDETVKLYKEGVELSLFIEKNLSETEQEVCILKKTLNNSFILEDFGGDHNG